MKVPGFSWLMWPDVFWGFCFVKHTIFRLIEVIGCKKVFIWAEWCERNWPIRPCSLLSSD